MRDAICKVINANCKVFTICVDTLFWVTPQIVRDAKRKVNLYSVWTSFHSLLWWHYIRHSQDDQAMLHMIVFVLMDDDGRSRVWGITHYLNQCVSVDNTYFFFHAPVYSWFHLTWSPANGGHFVITHCYHVMFVHYKQLQ